MMAFVQADLPAGWAWTRGNPSSSTTEITFSITRWTGCPVSACSESCITRRRSDIGRKACDIGSIAWRDFLACNHEITSVCAGLAQTSGSGSGSPSPADPTIVWSNPAAGQPANFHTPVSNAAFTQVSGGLAAR
jgi:hypothetical protein